MKSLRKLLIDCFCFLGLHTHAQLNSNDTLNWQIKMVASGSLLDGNVSRLLLVHRLELAYAQPA